uniref:beta-galactosidase n=1 Tax=Oryza meridionalis TaxID=40149 RepID=A0A0E0FBN8_9ORYZ
MAASRGPPLLGFRALALALLLAILLLLGCSAPAAYAGAEGVLRQVVGRRGDDGGGGNFFEPFNVTYDHRAVLIGGKRRMLVSAGLHYPRATSEMWPSLIAKCKEGGADVIETYVFWNGHEPAKGQYYFEERFDLVKFVKLVAAEGLFLFLRIGPYACAEWNFGYADWGGALPHRSAEDSAFAVARFYQRGGSLQNYYMYFGGTNFARTAGGPLQITSYDYDAPIDEYGILRQPKWGHLKDLHTAIKLCEPALIAVDGSPQYIKLGSMQEAHVYSTGEVHTNGSMAGNAQICSAFLANIDEHKYASVWIFGKSYSLPPWSVSILPDCENVAFNTARIGAQTSVFTVESGSPSRSSRHKPSILSLTSGGPYLSSTWWTSKETIGTWGGNNFAVQGILEHLNVTKDISDYLWYTTRVNISDADIAFWSSKGVLPSLTIDKIRDVARVFVNGKLAGSQVGHWVSLKQPIQLVEGLNELTLLSEIVGLQNYGAFLEKDGAGFRGQVTLTGLSDGDVDLTNSLWTYQVGLKGEFSMIYAPEKQGCAGWSRMQDSQGQ